jgi:hypothetical protein
MQRASLTEKMLALGDMAFSGSQIKRFEQARIPPDMEKTADNDSARLDYFGRQTTTTLSRIWRRQLSRSGGMISPPDQTFFHSIADNDAKMRVTKAERELGRIVESGHLALLPQRRTD